MRWTHPAQDRFATAPLGTMSPTLFEQPRGLFNPPQETDVWKSSEMGPYSFSSLSKTTTKSNCFQMSLQRQHFLVSYLKTLSVGPARVLVRPGCWSGQGVGPARVLVRPGCWSGQGVGLARVLVRPGCWSGQGVGLARVLVWPGCWSGQCLYPRPPAQQTSTLPTELMYSC